MNLSYRSLALIGFALLLTGCPGGRTVDGEKTAGEKGAAQDPANVKDEPIAIADGSARLLFRTRAVELDRIAPQYGCCLAAPAVKGDKEIQIFLPQSSEPGSDLVKSKSLKLGSGDVVEFYLDRRGEGGWTSMSSAKNPLPQLILVRRDLTDPLAMAHVPEVEAFKESGRWGWLFLAEEKPEDEPKLTLDAAFASATGFRREYALPFKNARLGKLVVKRAGGGEESADLGGGCAIVQICSGADCFKKAPSPCK